MFLLSCVPVMLSVIVLLPASSSTSYRLLGLNLSPFLFPLRVQPVQSDMIRLSSSYVHSFTAFIDTISSVRLATSGNRALL